MFGINGVIRIRITNFNPPYFNPKSIARNSLIFLVRFFLIKFLKKSLPKTNAILPPSVVANTVINNVKKYA